MRQRPEEMVCAIALARARPTNHRPFAIDDDAASVACGATHTACGQKWISIILLPDNCNVSKQSIRFGNRQIIIGVMSEDYLADLHSISMNCQNCKSQSSIAAGQLQGHPNHPQLWALFERFDIIKQPRRCVQLARDAFHSSNLQPKQFVQREKCMRAPNVLVRSR